MLSTSASFATPGSSNSYSYDALGRLVKVVLNDGGTNGATTITYTYDAAGNRTQSITSTSSNTAPTAANDSISTSASTAVTYDPRINDTDPQGDYLTISSIVAGTGPHHGTVVINSGGNLGHLYPHSFGYTGTDSFGYKVSDSHRISSTAATDTITVVADPVANTDALVVVEATPGNPTTASLDPRTNDTFPSGFPLTVTNAADGAHGATSVNTAGTLVTYQPAYNYLGTDSFTYTVSDGASGTATGTVNVTVAQPPSANPDSVLPAQNVPAVNFDPRTNDPADPNGGTLSIATVASPTTHGGTVTNNGGTSLTYTPASGFTGTDTFTYTVKDTLGLTSAATTITATVMAYSPPTAVNDNMIIDDQGSGTITPAFTQDVRINDLSASTAYPLTISAVSTPAKGTTTTNGTSVTYTYGHSVTVTKLTGPFTDTDSFTYTITDGTGHYSTATVSVSIEVDPSAGGGGCGNNC